MAKVSIGYASQTGTAEHIAKHIQQELEAMSVDSIVYPLDKFAGIDYSSFHVFVISSTGDGDAPEHSLPFYKWLRKLKKMDDQPLQGLDYCLLGLGDTNYTTFNGNAKRTLKFFKELNLNPVFRNELADDAVGLESFVDPWIDELLQYITKRFKSDSSKESPVEYSTSEPPVESLRTLTLQTRSVLFKVKVDSNDFTPSRLPAHVKWTIQGTVPPTASIFDFHESCRNSGDILFKSTTHSILSGKCLTLPESLKTTVLATISTDGHHYKAGDSIGIFVPNEASLISDLVSVFGYSLTNNPIIQHTEYGDMSLYDLLRYKVDLKFPSKRFFRLIAEYANDSNEKNTLLFLTSKQGASEFNKLRDAKLNLLDILNGFPSCVPPIYSLSLLDILKPRYYSVVKFDPELKTVDIVFNLEQYKAGDVDRIGLATNYIDTLLLHPRTYNEVVQSHELVLALPWPTTSFNLDHSFPVVFIGPGSGIAPYLQFINELALNQRAILIQGCRGSEEWILNQELKSITTLKEIPYFVAYSRSPSCSIQAVHLDKIYADTEIKKIGDKLGYEKTGAYCWDVLNTFSTEILELFDDDAVFYLCGDASNMVKMFMETMKIIISDVNKISLENANKVVQTMVKNKKIRMDVWG